ncbi:MAG: hypothetical protein AAF292_14775 [Pseudomonadota bacterium]
MPLLLVQFLGKEPRIPNDNSEILVEVVAEDDDPAFIAFEVSNNAGRTLRNFVFEVYPKQSNVSLEPLRFRLGRFRNGKRATFRASVSLAETHPILLKQDSFVFGFDDLSTVEGIDLNDDGVRDDVEAYIVSQFSGEPDLQILLHEHAHQLIELQLSKSFEEAEPVFSEAEISLHCVFEYDSENKARGLEVAEAILDRVDNTRARRGASRRAYRRVVSVSRTFRVPSDEETPELCRSLIDSAS